MPRPRPKTLLAAAFTVSALVLTGCGGTGAADETDPTSGAVAHEDWPDPFVVAVIPSEERMELDPDDDVALAAAAEELGLNIEYHQANSYSAVIEAQRAGQAHMARYGPFSYVLAADSGVDLHPFVTTADSADAQAGYHSVASVRADSDIESLEDAAGKRVCFVDPASTSGYLFPSAGLLEAGVDPESNDIERIFAGGHDASVLSLIDDQCDIAFSTEAMATENLIESGQISDGDIKQIWQSELIPSSPWAITADVPEDLREALTELFINDLNVDAMQENGTCDEAEENCGLGSTWGFVQVEDSVYDGVREVCDITESESCTSIEE